MIIIYFKSVLHTMYIYTIFEEYLIIDAINNVA